MHHSIEKKAFRQLRFCFASLVDVSTLHQFCFRKLFMFMITAVGSPVRMNLHRDVCEVSCNHEVLTVDSRFAGCLMIFVERNRREV